MQQNKVENNGLGIYFFTMSQTEISYLQKLSNVSFCFRYFVPEWEEITI